MTAHMHVQWTSFSTVLASGHFVSPVLCIPPAASAAKSPTKRSQPLNISIDGFAGLGKDELRPIVFRHDCRRSLIPSVVLTCATCANNCSAHELGGCRPCSWRTRQAKPALRALSIGSCACANTSATSRRDPKRGGGRRVVIHPRGLSGPTRASAQRSTSVQLDEGRNRGGGGARPSKAESLKAKGVGKLPRPLPEQRSQGPWLPTRRYPHCPRGRKHPPPHRTRAPTAASTTSLEGG